ncbi:alpha/beta hydrolase [Mangrovicella endophytica]|uniref:alpha/beta hydrolase n=1 Tax=Mangrovicella endophytica TaxID=2066697 RepID=UPI000C9DE39F|nr:alpha/beta hydrolase [Mangrovicella endophytica]
MQIRALLVLCGLLAALSGLPGCANVLNATTSQAGYTVQSDLRYGEGRRNDYDLYIPNNAGPKTPVVVFFHGGGWDTGNKDQYLFVGQSLASAGVIVAVPNYRLYPSVKFPDFVEDGAKAVAAITRTVTNGQAGVPAGRHPIFLMGHSAGAHIAALLNYDERYLKAVGTSNRRISGFIGLAGPYDFLPITYPRFRQIFPVPLWEQSQPINFVGGGEPAALIINGDADTTVVPRNAQSLADTVKRKGGRAELKIYPGFGHLKVLSALSTRLSGDSDIRETILAFIRHHS